MHVAMSVALPRDAQSVPAIRKLCAQTLRALGVTPDCVADLELALSEACSNVLRHSMADDDYRVRVTLLDVDCVIEVIDRGTGFDGTRLGHEDAEISAEAGRGIQIMRALTDEVRFHWQPGAGSVVRMVKRLDVEPHTPLAVLRPHGTSATRRTGSALDLDLDGALGTDQDLVLTGPDPVVADLGSPLDGAATPPRDVRGSGERGDPDGAARAAPSTPAGQPPAPPPGGPAG